MKMNATVVILGHNVDAHDDPSLVIGDPRAIDLEAFRHLNLGDLGGANLDGARNVVAQ